MSLVPFNAERFVETAKHLLMHLRVLGGIEPDFSKPELLDDLIKKKIADDQAWAKRYPDRPELLEGLWLTPQDHFRDLFDNAWEGYRRCIARLDVILNHGDVHLLDVSMWQMQQLLFFWDWIEGGRTTKPDFVDDGPQELALAAVVWAETGKMLTDAVAKSFHLEKLENGSPQRVEPLFTGELYTPFQLSILRALSGKALKKEDLASALDLTDASRLYKPGGIKELMKSGKVENQPRIGYFRPDRPPPQEV